MSAPAHDSQVIRARRELAALIPYGWSWEVTRDRFGVVCAAWRQGPGVPEPVHLEARSARDLADEIALYLDSLQAALEIASGRGGRLVESSHGAAA